MEIYHLHVPTDTQAERINGQKQQHDDDDDDSLSFTYHHYNHYSITLYVNICLTDYPSRINSTILSPLSLSLSLATPLPNLYRSGSGSPAKNSKLSKLGEAYKGTVRVNLRIS